MSAKDVWLSQQQALEQLARDGLNVSTSGLLELVERKVIATKVLVDGARIYSRDSVMRHVNHVLRMRRRK